MGELQYPFKRYETVAQILNPRDALHAVRVR